MKRQLAAALAGVMLMAALTTSCSDVDDGGENERTDGSTVSGYVTETGVTEDDVPPELTIPDYLYDDSIANVYTNVDISEEEKTYSFDVEKVKMRYGFSQLSSAEQEVYLDLLEGMLNFEEMIVVPQKLTYDRFVKVKSLLMIEDYSLFYLNERYSPYMNEVNQRISKTKITYNYSPAEVAEMNRQTEAKVNEILMQLKPTMNNYDVVKFFHDYIVLNCSYDMDAEHRLTPYGALVDGKAICEGYAKAFAMLCDRVGIENMIVTGNNDQNHMWNMVKIDGDWYHVDVTFDDTNKEILSDLVVYQYFLAPDKIVKNGMTIDTDKFVPPPANSVRYYYYVYNKCYVSDYNKIDETVKDAIKRAFTNGEKYVEIKFATPELYDAAMNYLLDDLIENRQGAMRGLLTDAIAETGASVMSVTPFQMKSYGLLMVRINLMPAQTQPPVAKENAVTGVVSE